jgi:hypothetical protein
VNFGIFLKFSLTDANGILGKAETTVAAGTWVAGVQADSATLVAVALAILRKSRREIFLIGFFLLRIREERIERDCRAL